VNDTATLACSIYVRREDPQNDRHVHYKWGKQTMKEQRVDGNANLTSETLSEHCESIFSDE